MYLFYTPEVEIERLPDEEAAHCVRVLRLKEGDEISLTDGKGSFYKAMITSASAKRCTYRILEKNEPAPLWTPRIVIAVAPTKNMDRMEWLVEKMTEIGVDEVVPLLCAHSERKVLKEERLVKIAVSAMKQSLKPTLPKIRSLQSFRDLIETPFAGQKFIAHCYPQLKQELKQVYCSGQDALVLIGPEGDFSEEEVAWALDKEFLPVSLGNTRLRTETAALVACHTIRLLGD